MTLLKTENISKIYSHGDQRLVILENLNMVVRKHELLAVTGISGVGKSTLLHILGGLDRPTGGEVFLEGASIYKSSERELARFRNQKIGFVFQFYYLLPDFNALENVMIPLIINKVPAKIAKEKAARLLRDVGLEERMTHKPGKLSGGEQQRVAIARALANEPLVLLADEPTGNLDEKTAANIIELFRRLNREQKITIVLVTHNEEIAKNAHRHYKIHNKNLRLVS